jgi:hypothetical protein
LSFVIVVSLITEHKVGAFGRAVCIKTLGADRFPDGYGLHTLPQVAIRRKRPLLVPNGYGAPQTQQD